MTSKDSWDQYSHLVLQQLETLSKAIDSLRQELQDVKRELVEIKVKEDRVQDLKVWKEKIDDIASPVQLQNIVEDVEELKEFKTRSVTIFAVVQFMMATALAISNLF